MSDTPESDAVQRITEYLQSGGLFNPEMMEHDKVRDLLIQCRDELVTVKNERDKVNQWREDLRSKLHFKNDQINDLAAVVIALRTERDKARVMVSVAREALVFIGDRHPDGNPIYSIKSAAAALARLDQIGKEANE